MRLARSVLPLAFSVGSGVVALVIAVVAARHIAEIPWPALHGNPGLLGRAAVLSLLGYTFKAYGWGQLVATHERPQPLALAAANGRRLHHGARTSRAIRRCRPNRDRPPVPSLSRWREGLCLSLVMLGLIDGAALGSTRPRRCRPSRPLDRITPRSPVLVGGVGLAAAAVIVALPRLASSPSSASASVVGYVREPRRCERRSRRGRSYPHAGSPARWACFCSSVHSDSASRSRSRFSSSARPRWRRRCRSVREGPPPRPAPALRS